MEPTLISHWLMSSISCLVLLIEAVQCFRPNNSVPAVIYHSDIKPIFLNSLSTNNNFMEELIFPENKFKCEETLNLTEKTGFIKSPNYPKGYRVPLHCHWNILGNPGEIITIRFEEIDIEIPSELHNHCYRTPEFLPSICCTRNYLKISSALNEQVYCGTRHKRNMFISSSNAISVEFKARLNENEARGFYFSYKIECPKSRVLCPITKACVAHAANCTTQLCGPRSTLCPDGRCIPQHLNWSCDGDSCGDGNNEKCLKNSVITWAIIGSLICLLLVVIAISCAIRLFTLRSSQMAHLREAQASSTAIWPPFPNCDIPFPVSTGDLDASLFRLDHSVFLREPPPSYASTMGGYTDAEGFNNSYMEQYRRYRRQRRCRRMVRRQQRLQAGGGGATQMFDPNTGEPIAVDATEVSLGLPGETSMAPLALSLPLPRTVSLSHQADLSPTTIGQTVLQLEDTAKKLIGAPPSASKHPAGPSLMESAVQHLPLANSRTISVGHSSSTPSVMEENLTIELEPLPALTNFDCDSQPLIR